VNHLIVSSEPLQGDNTWIELRDLDVVGVDWRMSLYRGRIEDDGQVELEAGYKPDAAEAARAVDSPPAAPTAPRADA